MTDLVIVSLEAWDEVWRRNQHLVSALSSAGHVDRVLWVEPASDPVHALRRRRRPHLGAGLREVPGPSTAGPARVWTWQPTKWLPRGRAPSAGRRWAEAVVAQAQHLGFHDPLLWVNDPQGAALLDLTDWPALYDITDDWASARRTPRQAARLQREEEALLRRCAEVVVCSPDLARTKGRDRPVTLIPNAVDLSAYADPGRRPPDLPSGPVAVYVGTVHRDRIDVELCVRTARAVGGRGTVVLVGPAPLEPADLSSLQEAGVVLLGPRPSSTVPGYLCHADVLLVPHVVDDFTRSLDPIKAYEYRAAARPVVATPVAGFTDSADPRVTVAPAERFPEAVLTALVRSGRSDESVRAPGAGVPEWSDRARDMASVLLRLEAVRRGGA
jgi:teichuronic acid biosynthesis glycosyltransferase TuaH